MAKSKDEIHKGVSDFYAKLVKGNEKEGKGLSCCGDVSRSGWASAIGYSGEELEGLPDEAVGSSFGCGNPLAFAEVKEGEVVLDLGSGTGIDCFLAADRVGKSGKVIGLDMTQEMVDKATRTAKDNGYTNVEFLKGKIEKMPVESSSVDWVISNCVINLSPEKEKVFAESYRVLKPNGRLLISDVVAENLPPSLKESMAAWAGCIAGAVTEDEYLGMIREAGFDDVQVVDRLDHVQDSCCQPVKISSIRVGATKGK